MTLHLSPQDQQRLSEALGILASPFLHPNLDTWRRVACNAVRPLLKADKVSMLIPIEGQIDVFSDDFDPTIKHYPDEFAQFAVEFGVFQRLRTLGVADRPMLFGDRLGAYYRSAYWNEYLAPLGGYNGLTISTPILPGATLASHAQIVAHHDSPHATPFGERGVALGRLLLGSLQAGALAWLRLAQSRQALRLHVDGLPIAAALYAPDGRELYRNDAARAVLDLKPATPGLQDALTTLARPVPAGRLIPPPPMHVGRFTLRATRVGAAEVWQDAFTLVTIDAASISPAAILTSEPAAKSAEATLRVAFNLTRQQARIALHLAARRSTAEIAATLSLSPHTVRRHTEQVLERMGLTRRTDVEDRVRKALANGRARMA